MVSLGNRDWVRVVFQPSDPEAHTALRGLLVTLSDLRVGHGVGLVKALAPAAVATGCWRRGGCWGYGRQRWRRRFGCTNFIGF